MGTEHTEHTFTVREKRQRQICNYTCSSTHLHEKFTIKLIVSHSSGVVQVCILKIVLYGWLPIAEMHFTWIECASKAAPEKQ